MLIRHPGEETLGQQPENAFVAYDSHGRFAGASAVCESMNPLRFPRRPLRYRLDVSCQTEAFGVLVGAAMARAMMLRVEQSQTPARIYMECEPDDKLRLNEVQKHGFQVDDELVKWRKTLARAPVTHRLAEDYVAMRDALEDEIERNYFCQRFARIMDTDFTAARAWLKEKKNMPKFQRLLVVNRDGLAGEMILWVENRVGEIGYVFVTPECRKQGVGSYLFEMAREHLAGQGVKEAMALIPRSMPELGRRASGAGYRQAETVMLYAGIDL